jgi:integrase
VGVLRTGDRPSGGSSSGYGQDAPLFELYRQSKSLARTAQSGVKTAQVRPPTNVDTAFLRQNGAAPSSLHRTGSMSPHQLVSIARDGQTIANDIAVLRHILRLGHKTRNVEQLPWFPTIKAENVRAVFFTDDEFDCLIAALEAVIAGGRDVGNDWLLPFTIVKRWIGTRRDELLHAERRLLDLDAGKITLDPGTTKNGEGRVIYLRPAALAALRAWDEKTRELERERGIIIRCVFHRHSRPIGEFPYSVWHDACGAANLGKRRVPHDFRRTAARSHRWKGVSEGIVMKIFGHKTRPIFERYDIKNEDDLREAAAVATPEMGE